MLIHIPMQQWASLWLKHVFPDFIVNFPLWLRNDYRTIYAMADRFGWDVHDKMPFLHFPDWFSNIFHITEMPIAINLPAMFIVFVLTIYVFLRYNLYVILSLFYILL